MKDWTNRITREVYIEVLEHQQDPLGAAREWTDVGNGSAVALLARQLRKDFYREYSRVHGELAGCLFRSGLRLVDWKQVVARLLMRAVTCEEDSEDRCC